MTFVGQNLLLSTKVMECYKRRPIRQITTVTDDSIDNLILVVRYCRAVAHDGTEKANISQAMILGIIVYKEVSAYNELILGL